MFRLLIVIIYGFEFKLYGIGVVIVRIVVVVIVLLKVYSSGVVVVIVLENKVYVS